MKIFTSLNEVFECYGKENIIPLTSLPQVIFYIRNYRLQPKWVDESDRNQGHMVFYFHKGESFKAYQEWMNNRPVNDVRQINKLNLISPICPSVNHYLKPRTFMKNGKPMVVMYEPTEAKNTKNNLLNILNRKLKNKILILFLTKHNAFIVIVFFILIELIKIVITILNCY